MKKVIRNIIYAVLFLAMIGAFIYLGTKNYSDEIKVLKDNETMAKNFSKLDKTNIYDILKSNEAAKFMNSGTGIILFCIKDSTWCNYYVSMVNSVAKEMNFEDVKYLDITSDRENNSYYYQKIIVSASKFLPKDDKENYMFLTPNLFVLENGLILGHNDETSQVTGYTNPESYWTKEKIAEFETELKELFNKLNKDQ